MRISSSMLALLIALMLRATSAAADKYALTVDAGGGLGAQSVPTPYVLSTSTQWGVSPSFSAGVRYALSNSIELSASGFFEPWVSYFHSGATIATENGSFPGTLSHGFQRFGGLAGGRLVYGAIFRLVAGLELGWCRRAYSGFRHFDVTDSSNPRDYQLSLPDFSVDNFLVSPLVGIEWALGDRISLSVLPRLHVLLGPNPMTALTGTLVFSYSWYL